MKMQESTHFQLVLMILLHKAEFMEAQKLSNIFLEKQRGNINNYITIANVFEQYRQYETAVKIYEKARKITGDENLFNRELAYDYEFLKNHKKSITEFIKLMENRNSYSGLVLSRFKKMLKEDPSVIKYIKDTSGESKNNAVNEIYALCLGEIGEYDKALKEYEKFPAMNILKFAERMDGNERTDVAIQAYDIFLQRSVNVLEKANTKIKMSNIYIEQNNLDQAEMLLLEIYNNKVAKTSKNKFKTKANRQCRELLAQIYLRQNASSKKIIQILEEAKKFAYNKTEINSIEYKIIHFLIMNGESDQAKKKLSQILENENSGSDTFKKGYFYSFLIAVMTNDASADSLLGELIINIPSDEITNDALLLLQSTNQFNDDADKSDFLAAYRKKSLFKNTEAIELLRSIYDRSKVEDVLFLAGEWAAQSGKLELAIEIFNHEYLKPDLQQFAILKLTEIDNDRMQKNKISIGFLQNNPQSIFSPQFRRILAE